MKKSYIAIGLTVFVAAAAFIFLASSSQAGSRKPAKDASFEGSPAWEKLDLRMRQAWKEATSKGGDKDQVLECIMKAKNRLSEDDKAALSAAGFQGRTFAGRIVTGSLKADDVPDVARLPFIVAMELAVPMTLKKQ
ncbi:MAG: hypothetical protein ABH871_01995 [Pseudomonadota bacterium]